MSWLSGNKSLPQVMPGLPQPSPPGDLDGGDKKKDSRMEYSFDSTALEGMASELESSSLTTMEKEAELRHKLKMMKEANMRVKAEIEWGKIRMKAAEERITKFESIITYCQVGLGMIMASAGVSTLVVSYCGVKHSFGLIFRYLESRLRKPSLVRETSRFTIGSAVKHPFKTIAQLIKGPEDLMKGIILKPTLEERLRDIAMATRHTQRNTGHYRNMLLHGPPGTGKSMFAKRLAKHSGMHYAMLAGGDVAPMGKEGVTAVHKLFDWAQTSRKGVVLFLDEADTLLRKRNTEVISEEMKAAFNAFLYRTGEQSNKFMVVHASNQPEQFDWAVNDRLDDVVEFEIPSYEERERLVRHYFEKFILEPATSKSGRLCVAEFDFGKKWAEIAEKTEGLSGREISKLGLACQAKAYAEDGVLTEEMINDIVNNAVQQHKEKVEWQLRQAMSSRVMPTITAPDTAASKEPVTPTTVQQPSRDISTW